MALTATLTRAENLDNPVTLPKLRNLVDTTTVTVAGTAETANIANNAVTAPKIASNAVTTLKILDANVTAAKLADSAVETVKIADEAVTAAKLADEAVTEDKIEAAFLASIMALAQGGMFIGEIRQFCDVSLPAGFVLCDGGTYAHTDYPMVAARRAAGTDPFFKYTGASTYAGGSFSVPDLKGKFIRAWQTGDVLQTPVASSVGPHSHDILGTTSATTPDASGARQAAVCRVLAGYTTASGTPAYNANNNESTPKPFIKDNDGAETLPPHMFLVFAVYIGQHA